MAEPPAPGFLEIEIIRESLIAVVNEMRANMIRASYSPIIYEGHDFSCCLMKGDGRQVALGRDDHPLHMLAVPVSTAAILAQFGDGIVPGDVFLHNDPYTGGTHLNDMLMLWPVFIAGRLMFFAAVRCHWNDVGGMTPGSLSGRVTDIYQEGLRVQPTKVVSAGVLNTAFMDMLFGNMRNSEERRGDFDSMLGACGKAAERLQRVAQKFGPDRVEAGMLVMLERAEQAMRRLISRLPDGSYTAEGFLESNGHTPEPMAIRLCLTIAGDAVTADFTGTSPQTAGPTNVGPAMAPSSVFSVLKAFLDPGTPINHGAYAPIHVIAPERSFINARLPAPCGGMAEVKFGIDSVVAAALMQIPTIDRVGDCKGTANHYHVSGGADEMSDPFILYEWPAGGTGGIAGMDGNNAVRTYLEGDFNSIQSVEVIEAGLPVRIESLMIHEGSCGDGRDRGGFGLRRTVRLLAPQGLLSVLSERNRLSSYGVDGGGAPLPNGFTVHRDGAVLQPSAIPGKVSGFKLRQGDLVVVETAGGGGCGDPLTRDPAKVMTDVRQGYLTPHQAESRYGVVPGSEAATLSRRQAMRQARVIVRVQVQPEEMFEGTRRMLRIHPATAAAAGLQPGDVAELALTQGASQRLWVRCDDAAAPDRVIMGPSSAAMLAGAKSVWLRALRPGSA
jgi:N-methylhydantoinase B